MSYKDNILDIIKDNPQYININDNLINKIFKCPIFKKFSLDKKIELMKKVVYNYGYTLFRASLKNPNDELIMFVSPVVFTSNNLMISEDCILLDDCEGSVYPYCLDLIDFLRMLITYREDIFIETLKVIYEEMNYSSVPTKILKALERVIKEQPEDKQLYIELMK